MPSIVCGTLQGQLNFSWMHFHFTDEVLGGLPMPMGNVKLGPKLWVHFLFYVTSQKTYQLFAFPIFPSPSSQICHLSCCSVFQHLLSQPPCVWLFWLMQPIAGFRYSSCHKGGRSNGDHSPWRPRSSTTRTPSSVLFASGQTLSRSGREIQLQT